MVLAVGGMLVYITYKVTEPLRRSSMGQTLNNGLRNIAPHSLRHRFPGGMIFPPLVSGIFALFGGAIQQSMKHVKVIEE